MEKTKKKYKLRQSSKSKKEREEIVEQLDNLRKKISKKWDDVTVKDELNEQRKTKQHNN